MYNVAIIGCGKIAENHLKVLESNPNFNNYSIISKTNKKCKSLVLKYNIKKIYNNLNELCNDNKVDCIFILIPAYEVLDVCKIIAKTNKPIFLEKPPGLNFKEALKIKKLFGKYKNLNMIGYNRRFYSIFSKGLNIIKKRGRLESLIIEGHEKIWRLEKLQINKKIYENWAYANSSHTIDLIRFFAGEIKNIKVLTNSSRLNYSALIETKNNIFCHYISNWNTSTGWSIKLFGNKTTVVFEPLENGYWEDEKGKRQNLDKSHFDKNYKDGFYDQILHFHYLIKHKKYKYPIQNINETIKTMKLVKKIYNLK